MLRIIAFKFISPPNRKYFLSTVASKLDTTCPICLDELKDPVTTKCNHEFCFACILNLMKYTCPLCRENLCVKYREFVLNKTDLKCFRKALGYVLPQNTKEDAFLKLSGTHECSFVRMKVHQLISVFHANMLKDFVIN